MSIETEQLKNTLEAALLAFGQPLSLDRLVNLFSEDEQVSRQEIRDALQQLQLDCEGRGVELVEVGSGYRYQARKDYGQWVSRLWEEKPPRYSRALLETLALVAYRQPITRAEVEDVRGVTVSSHIMKTLQERDWVRVVGHKDVPGKPALYATTKTFLDYFNLKSLDELPSLMEIRDLDKINAELDFQAAPDKVQETEEVKENTEVQGLADEPDERLLPDGEGDHGDGVGESNGEIAAEAAEDSAIADEAVDISGERADLGEESLTGDIDREEANLHEAAERNDDEAMAPELESELSPETETDSEDAKTAAFSDSSIEDGFAEEHYQESEYSNSDDSETQFSDTQVVENQVAENDFSENDLSETEPVEINAERDKLEQSHSDDGDRESGHLETNHLETNHPETADFETTDTDIVDTDSDSSQTGINDSHFEHRDHETNAADEDEFSDEEHPSERLSAAEPNA